MGKFQSKTLSKKIIQNKEKYNNQQNKIIQNEYENEKEEDNEIIIELQISNNEKEKEINILCDKEQLIKDNEDNKDYYKKIKLIHQKNLIILIKIIQNYT